MVVRRKVRTAVQDHIDALRDKDLLGTQGEALAALALNLAAQLDVGEPATMTASWARELRVTLQLLQPEEGADDSDPDAWLDHLDGGPTPVQHPPGP